MQHSSREACRAAVCLDVLLLVRMCGPALCHFVGCADGWYAVCGLSAYAAGFDQGQVCMQKPGMSTQGRAVCGSMLGCQ
jgi:hypothetical protein